ncbi:transmembrane protein, putative (macronuclear) [Tetrahymena thermophila SB210]|uniref:Transmembrane protein, putative n=1 Tax=Tetrahymena thermophila (strain SB210) TaxID=312017 RepID=W7XL48_TETTS|nr:transmembrane protein, putative [Tetrahymena thermophila SB210]EWS75664.1 transmembrane protein, putative [Tetrahymena thermophila SB210]|eukprot:XP_012651810.1 transmembrane protein, putative [Tetrahymena thermophila SB210]
MNLKYILTFLSFSIPFSLYFFKDNYGIIENPLPEFIFAVIYLGDLIYYKNYDYLKLTFGITCILQVIIPILLMLGRVFYLIMIVLIFSNLILYIFAYIYNILNVQTKLTQKYILITPILTSIQIFAFGLVWGQLKNESITSVAIILLLFFLIVAFNSFAWIRCQKTNIISFIFGVLTGFTMFASLIYLCFYYDTKQDQDYKSIKFLYLLIQILAGSSGMHHKFIQKIKTH